MKTIFIPKSIEEIKLAEPFIDGYLLGIKDLSVNLPVYFTLEEIKNIRKNTKKDIFISLNRNMHNNDLPFLKEVLLELEKMDIVGILYYDIALVNLKQTLNLKNNLVWNQEHLTTNSVTTNFWYKEGVSMTYLSSDISLKEILEIKKEVKSKILVDLFGYIPIFTSKRHLINNYLKTFHIKSNSKSYYLNKENKEYPIIDEENTTIYSSHILNATEQYLVLKENGIEYGVINSFNIKTGIMIEILKLFKQIDESNALEIKEKINSYLKNTDEGFLNKETIYKVVK